MSRENRARGGGAPAARRGIVAARPQAVTEENRVAAELAANGIRSFFSAALTSHLDYARVLPYPRRAGKPPSARAGSWRSPTRRSCRAAPIRSRAASRIPAALCRCNVVVLLEESLGAEFVGAYGDKRGLTPNLDRIADESLVFTRSLRHRHPHGARHGSRDGVVSAGPGRGDRQARRQRGHVQLVHRHGARAATRPTFIYGGYGTFDNMNYFFRNNGYRVIDRTRDGRAAVQQHLGRERRGPVPQRARHLRRAARARRAHILGRDDDLEPQAVHVSGGRPGRGRARRRTGSRRALRRLRDRALRGSARQPAVFRRHDGRDRRRPRRACLRPGGHTAAHRTRSRSSCTARGTSRRGGWTRS